MLFADCAHTGIRRAHNAVGSRRGGVWPRRAIRSARPRQDLFTDIGPPDSDMQAAPTQAPPAHRLPGPDSLPLDETRRKPPILRTLESRRGNKSETAGAAWESPPHAAYKS